MTTIEELKYYCNELSPVGALMLTGEWGCGKTYLIEHILKDELADTHIILRVSLFGIASLATIDEYIHNEWVKAYLEDKEWDGKSEVISKFQNKMSKLPLPENWKNILSFDPTSLLDATNTLNNKKVVLVFDDLERSKLDTVDILGCINEYCENRGFHTIVIANEDKLKDSKKVPKPIVAEAEAQQNKEKNSFVFVLNCMKNSAENDELSYDEIKEKIIERTIKYVPDYKSIVHAIIEKTEYNTQEYHEFLKHKEIDILNVFAPSNEQNKAEHKRPHNIRSLKCALQDFYRVYEVLTENGFDSLDKWLCSFISYILAYKANIAKEGAYGTLFTDKEVEKLYESFDNSKFMFYSVKKWILHGEWNVEELNAEINRIKERERAIEPSEIVKTHRVVDIDEDVLRDGFPKVLQMAYSGDLTLYEYVSFIMNCYWIRTYALDAKCVNWEKVIEGIKKQINYLIDNNIEDTHSRASINIENKESFSEQEWNAYTIIKEFWEQDVLIFNENKQLYLKTLKEDPNNIFATCINKIFNTFDTEMAESTIEAFIRCNNADKNYFANNFYKIWKSCVCQSNANKDEFISGFNYLLGLIDIEKNKLETEQKKIAIIHVNRFIDNIKNLIKEMNES